VLPVWFHVTVYDPMITAKYIRIVQRGANSKMDRFSLMRYGFFGKQETIMVWNYSKNDPWCFVKVENTFYKLGEPVFAMKCFDAILQQETKEILILEGFKLKHYMDELCISNRTKDKDNSELVVIIIPFNLYLNYRVQNVTMLLNLNLTTAC